MNILKNVLKKSIYLLLLRFEINKCTKNIKILNIYKNSKIFCSAQIKQILKYFIRKS